MDVHSLQWLILPLEKKAYPLGALLQKIAFLKKSFFSLSAQAKKNCDACQRYGLIQRKPASEKLWELIRMLTMKLTCEGETQNEASSFQGPGSNETYSRHAVPLPWKDDYQIVRHGRSCACPFAEVHVLSFRQATINEPSLSLSSIANLSGISRIARNGRCSTSNEVERKRKGSEGSTLPWVCVERG
ncbi:hypothetical protein LIER_38558 [Lithospermum erythrorhizon]|uniref:Uncharacterized protein n=1 Tax=Lithospermum erythrorhizon TaxID=34254 RepID=A0AAV3Q671_LITER